MTIAACYVTPEGVVLGADSTTTYSTTLGPHYFNHAQKLFEIGTNSTLGIVTWGLAGLNESSYRTLIDTLGAQLGDDTPTLQAVAEAWMQLFNPLYRADLAKEIAECLALHAMPPHNPGINPTPSGMRTQDQEFRYEMLRNNLVAGFCIAGHVKKDKKPAAFEVIFDPFVADPIPKAMPMGTPLFWGSPVITYRMLWGFDFRLADDFRASGKWNGSDQELTDILNKYRFIPPRLPIRDAVDFIHSSIAGTIKALKFSHLSQTCGGPIETAVITTDRRFRWVTHKEWNSAISEGEHRWNGM